MVTTWRLKQKDIKQLRVENKRIETEAKELQGHLNTQLKINSKGNEKLEEELESLKSQNELLRINLTEANQKPGKAEQRQLQVMESAAGIMREQAPGFAPAWEKALREAEVDMEASEGGLKKFIRKVLPSSKSSKSESSIEANSADKVLTIESESSS